MKIKTLLVDDEPLALKNLASIIQNYITDIDIVASAKNEEDAMEKIITLKPDLVFLDIELGGSSGFDILKQYPNRDFEVIFVTAHNEFGIEAVKAHAFDYILKPINKSELLLSIDRVLKKISEKRNPVTTNTPFKLSLSTMEGILFVDPEEILYAESEGRYTRFHLQNKTKHLVSKNIGEFETILQSRGFIRIHHSYLVNIKHILKYIRGRGGYVILSNGAELEVSSRKKDNFLDSLN